MTLPQAIQLALQHHQAGRLADAEALYRQVLAVAPQHADALHLLGVLALQAGRHELAVDLIRQAIAVVPGDPAFHANLAAAFFAQGRLDEAIAANRRALELNPASAEAHGNLGNALREKGQLAAAIASYRQALHFQPDSAETHNNLGNVLRDQGQLAAAISTYRRALQLRPGYAEAHYNLGNALADQGRWEEAVAAQRRALELQPGHAKAGNNLGNALFRLGRLEEALAAYRGAIEHQPDDALAHNNLGNALRELGRWEEALAAFHQAIALQPGLAMAYSNLGNTLTHRDRWEEAIGACRRALELQPDFADACGHLGNALMRKGALDEATAAYRRALELQPDDAMAHNNLGNAAKDSGRLDEAIASYRRATAAEPQSASLASNLIYSLHFQPGENAASLEEEQRRWNWQFGEPLRKFHRPHANVRDPERRLRIGYVSPDFWHHVICHFLTPLLEAHDRARFEIFCYASVKRPDAVTARLQKSADVWREVRAVPDDALAERIRADRIDVLVDLTQHMADNRLLVFARRPAPVQVAWLGYPASTGLPAIDYRLTDAVLEPEGAAWAESVEKAVRLPDSWFCFDPIDEYPEPGPLPALRVGHVTFGSLNNFCKINDTVLELWAEVLRAVEGSRLILQCPAGATQARVRAWFDSHGVAAHRLELVARTTTRADFLQLFARIDLALEPFPYNGGTTTCEALWMGIPVPTFPGTTAVSRLGLSILSAAAMPELIAPSPAEYVRLITRLAADLPRLAALRSTLRARMKASAFMDAPRFARNVERAYRTMWRAWCAREKRGASSA